MSNIRTSQSRYMTIDEDIYVALDIQTYSLYTALRYEGDYASDTSKVIKSIKYLCVRAKISRSQAHKSLNILEKLGLIKRENDERLGEVGLIMVSKHIGFYRSVHEATYVQKDIIPVHTVDRGVHTVDRGVHGVDRGVHGVDTYQESLQESFNNKYINAREDSKVSENQTGKIKPNSYVESTYDTAFKTERDKLDSDEYGGSALPPQFHVEPVVDDPPGFNAFFEIYPVKSSKRLARALWWEYKLESKALEIIEKVKQQKKLHVRWRNKEFIPSPVNYLKNEGWQDDIIEATKKDNKRFMHDHQSTEWIKTMGDGLLK